MENIEKDLQKTSESLDVAYAVAANQREAINSAWSDFSESIEAKEAGLAKLESALTETLATIDRLNAKLSVLQREREATLQQEASIENAPEIADLRSILEVFVGEKTSSFMELLARVTGTLKNRSVELANAKE